MRKVNSSAIDSISFNPFWMTVKFNHGRKYRYYGVRYKTYKTVRDSHSVGKAYNELIKGKFNSLAM